MKQFSLYPPSATKAPKPGQILIAEPLLNDANFTRSVILLCEHSDEGSVGFVLNHPTEIRLGDIIDGLPSGGPTVFKGGPVQPDTLHLMHRVPHYLGQGKKITNGVYWGGSFDDLYDLATNKPVKESDIRLFLGYSGWAPGQLEDEIKEGTWLIADASEDMIFNASNDELWKLAIASLGRKYAHLAHIPTDPQMN